MVKKFRTLPSSYTDRKIEIQYKSEDIDQIDDENSLIQFQVDFPTNSSKNKSYFVSDFPF